MMRVFSLVGVFVLAASSAVVAGERVTYKQECETANGKIAVSFSHQDDFKLRQKAANGAILVRQEPKQVIVFGLNPQPTKDGAPVTAKQLQERIMKQIRQMSQAQQVDLEFLEEGPAFTLPGGEKAASVMFAMKLSDEKGEFQLRVRVWHQIVVRDGQVCELRAEWLLDPDAVEIQVGTPQSRLVSQFKDTFKSLTIEDVE